jgi:hypothetical protein
MQNLEPFAFPALVNRCTHDSFRTGFVTTFFELEISIAQWLDCPASKHLGNLRNVGLRVTAIDAEGVQFHQLTRVVFVQPLRKRLGNVRVWHLRLKTCDSSSR